MITPSLRVIATAVIAVVAAGCSRTHQPDSRLGSPTLADQRAHASKTAKHGSNGLGGDVGRTGNPFQRDASGQAVGDIVYFSSDSTDLTPEARDTLALQARWLAQNRSGQITIEGHADERGTREYNIGLGVRRAETVRAFLVSNGLEPARIRTTSFGKERPVAMCNDISCWSQNRRAQTVVGTAATAQRQPRSY